MSKSGGCVRVCSQLFSTHRVRPSCAGSYFFWEMKKCCLHTTPFTVCTFIFKTFAFYYWPYIGKFSRQPMGFFTRSELLACVRLIFSLLLLFLALHSRMTTLALQQWEMRTWGNANWRHQTRNTHWYNKRKNSSWNISCDLRHAGHTSHVLLQIWPYSDPGEDKLLSFHEYDRHLANIGTEPEKKLWNSLHAPKYRAQQDPNNFLCQEVICCIANDVSMMSFGDVQGHAETTGRLRPMWKKRKKIYVKMKLNQNKERELQ